MKRIRTLDDLMNAAQHKRAVVTIRCLFGPAPAAFVIGMPGRTIWRLLRDGMYLYKPTERKKA